MQHEPYERSDETLRDLHMPGEAGESSERERQRQRAIQLAAIVGAVALAVAAVVALILWRRRPPSRLALAERRLTGAARRA
ncbi:MAG TPA: hypothetical protein VNL77_16635, partial [Roseiflexaceae bacterium]|nr:hypothetical protein [Roseiflexaceae bacterium]